MTKPGPGGRSDWPFWAQSANDDEDEGHRMRKRELVAAIAQELELPTAQVGQVLDRTFARIADELVAGGRFEIRGFGVFVVLSLPARKTYVPKTGQTVSIPARRVARFKETKGLRERLNPTREPGDKER